MLLSRICFVSDKRHLSSLVFSPTGFAQRERVTEGRDPETAGTDFWSGQKPTVALNGPVFLCCTDFLYPLVFLCRLPHNWPWTRFRKGECFNHQISLFIWVKVMIIILTSGSSAREKEENMKTVESLLEKGLIEVANKEEELKVGFLVEKYTTAHVKESRNVLKECQIKCICICCRFKKWPFVLTSVSHDHVLIRFVL